MRVKDIFLEVQEAIGSESDEVIFRALTRGIEMLANKGLYDPLIGTVDISVQDGYLVALPRDVKTPLRVNLDGNPSFARSRLFEFAANTNGSVDGAEEGVQWSDSGYCSVQSEAALPGRVSYKCSSSSDVGKTVTVVGKDTDGRVVRETLMASTSLAPGVQEFYEISDVFREETTAECQLWCRNADGDSMVARYYADETEPRYRVIKISKTATVARVLYRKHVFKIASKEDIINLHSGMAVILAAKAARYYLQENWSAAQFALEEAAKIINEEQATRQEAQAISEDVIVATNLNINTADSVIVADIYDDASAILGPIGRNQVFDEITTAIEILANKGQWDAQLGTVDIWKSANWDEVNASGTPGNGYLALPRYVDAILSVNNSGNPQMPRNRWFEFSLSGTGERNVSGFHKWDDLGEVVTVNQLPRDPDTRRVIPQKVVAIPLSPSDSGAAMKIYGVDADGREVVVTPNCEHLSLDPGDIVPLIEIRRITRDPSNGPVKLVCLNGDGTEGVLLGHYYPDETEPKYRAIKVQSKAESRLRIAYRKRQMKVTSLWDPIHLRSRMAIRTMLESMVARKTDLQGAILMEQLAVEYLAQERIAKNPTATGGLQFHSGSSPFHNENIQ